MRKAARILVLLAGMSIVFGIAMTAEAKEEMISRGTFRFEGTEGIVQIWAQDITLLWDKVSGIPEEAFVSDYYSQARSE